MSIAKLAGTGLPFNRKERYFTGTVFPMLVCAADFAHFGRLTELAGLGVVSVDARPESATVQFFTEYGFVESLMDADRTRFPEPPMGRDTPDVLIYVDSPRRVLLAIEAKMYDRPSTVALQAQIAAQVSMVGYLATRLGVAAADVAHVALLPERFAATRPLPGVRVITWEQVLDKYRDVAPAYYVEMLRVALEKYETLIAPGGSGKNAELRLSGVEIFERHRNGTLGVGWMGRAEGLEGAKLTEDIATGRWRTQRYECSSQAVDNRNWFPVAKFVARVK